MRDDFALFILTHGRPDNIVTLKTLAQTKYTGRWYLVIDDEDARGDEYRERYGDERVLVFSKEAVAGTFDVCDNQPERRGVVYARNALWDIARRVGVRYFAAFDDDYTAFSYRRSGRKPGAAEVGYHGWKVENLEAVLEAMVAFIEDTPTLTLCMSQGGDHMGGIESPNATSARLRRKAMNSFICDVERPFPFLGRINEDVNAYVAGGILGGLFFTYTPLQLDQLSTQTNPGGLTEMYLDDGTYVKSFYTVMLAPSAVTIRSMGRVSRRLHHHVQYRYAVPKILAEAHAK
jgi:hypothetical protein